MEKYSGICMSFFILTWQSIVKLPGFYFSCMCIVGWSANLLRYGDILPHTLRLFKVYWLLVIENAKIFNNTFEVGMRDYCGVFMGIILALAGMR